MSQLNREDMVGQTHDTVYILLQVLFLAGTTLEHLELQTHLQHSVFVLGSLSQ